MYSAFPKTNQDYKLCCTILHFLCKAPSVVVHIEYGVVDSTKLINMVNLFYYYYCSQFTTGKRTVVLGVSVQYYLKRE